MRRGQRVFTALAVVLATSLLGIGTGLLSADTLTELTRLNLGLMSLLPEPILDPLTDPPGKFHAVKPQEFDPARTNLVQSAWLPGIGCPTAAFIANPNATFTGVDGTTPYEDTACPSPTGDPNDKANEGLLLVKTGPTRNFASAVAELINVKGIVVTDLGYDIRKPGPLVIDPRGSHCGAGAPRFNLVTDTNGVVFIGCASPPPTFEFASGMGWMRLRWHLVTPVAVNRIVIVFDEGQDASGGPDQFGAAILDNIYLNGMVVGRGATDAS